jgi:hypothetical protein
MYDKNGSTVEAYARSPWWDLAKSFCKKSDSPPITIHSIPPSGRAEEVISQLLPKYYELREQLRLKEALMNLWVSREMPIGPNIPILAASLESIIKGWFKSRTSKSQGCYMDQASFEILVKSEIDAIQKELDSHFKTDGDKTKKIINTMLGSNSFGPTERYRNFFKEVGLELTQLEEDAIKERHKFIHGDAIFDKENWRQVSQRGRTIETLLNKVILKLLSYSGEYIDRSITPWESKVLS